MEKNIWLENLILFNSCVQRSGGIMDIISSYTQPDGDVLVSVVYTKLDNDQRIRYEKERIIKKEGSKRRMVLKRPIRTLRMALRYWYPKRLTLKCNPRVHAWLWWNF